MAAIAVEREELRLHEFDLKQGRLDFAQLGGLTAAYEISPQCVVVETGEGREIRITARRDLSNGKYVSEYERRGSITSNGSTYQVWAHTPAYQVCTADVLEACLEAAVLEPDRRPGPRAFLIALAELLGDDGCPASASFATSSF